MFEAYQFVTRHPEMLAAWVVDHLVISLVAIGTGAVFGATLGIFITGKGGEQTAEVVLYVAEIMMTVPSSTLSH